MISVCIPTYNGSKYLEACLQSICMQKVADFEIIVCDDCSSDNTVEIVKALQKTDNRIKLSINEKNLGLVGNWNRCIEIAQGEWIKLVFQDDLISPNCLEKMLQVTNFNTQLVLCEREFFFEENVTNEVKKTYHEVLRLFKLVDVNKIRYFSKRETCALINKYIPANFLGEPTSILFRKSIVKQIGLFNPMVSQHCDLEYWLRIISAYGFDYIPEKLVSFRVHNSSTTQKNNSQNYFSSFYVDRILVIYLLLFDPIYKEFRKNSSLFGLFNLRYTLFYVIYHADVFAKRNGEAVQKEMQLLKEKYPKIRQLQNQYFFYAPLNMAIRPFRKLFKF